MNSLHNFLQLMTGGQNFILDIELCLTWGCGPVAPWPATSNFVSQNLRLDMGESCVIAVKHIMIFPVVNCNFGIVGYTSVYPIFFDFV